MSSCHVPTALVIGPLKVEEFSRIQLTLPSHAAISIPRPHPLVHKSN